MYLIRRRYNGKVYQDGKEAGPNHDRVGMGWGPDAVAVFFRKPHPDAELKFIDWIEGVAWVTWAIDTDEPIDQDVLIT